MIPPIAPGQTDEKQNMVSWKNTFNMRQISLMNLATQLHLKNGNNRMANIANCRRTFSITSPAKSLDLLRKNLQSAINKDIDNVIKKYLDKFFQPAINNIKLNLGKDSVNEDHIRDVCKQILEDAKIMYKICPQSRDSSPYDYSDSETSIVDCRIGQSSPLHRKRKESDTDSETNHTQKRQRSQQIYLTSSASSTIAEYSHNCKLPIRREGPKWNPDRIHENTLFIMGAKANKVLGFGQTRGRLYVRHPDLVRYSGDQEDKEWLSSKNLMPPSGGKAYLMILDDIKELIESDDYRNSPNLQFNELRGFEVPPFLLNKIKIFIDHVRTDNKRPLINLDLFDLNHHCLTPPIGINSGGLVGGGGGGIESPGPSTPSDTVQLLESQPGSSTSSKHSDNNFVNIPEMSPNSNNSIISSTMTQSPSGLLSPNTLITMANADSGNVMVLKENTQNDTCLSNVLVSHLNSDNSQDF